MRTRNEIAQDIHDLEQTGTNGRTDSLEYHHHTLQELFAELEACKRCESLEQLRDVIA